MNLKKFNERINIICEPTNKFKTFMVSFYFHNELSEENAALNALLPYVLKQGSKNYKNMTEISNTLEELYGGAFDCSVVKKGLDQIIGFNFEFVSPDYIKDDDKYLSKVYDFIFDIIFNPVLENGIFLSEYVEHEKENMIDYIKGIINDKKEYAQLRCKEEMFSGEKNSVFKYGTVENIEKITPQELYNHYISFLSQGRIDVFITGNTELKEFEERLLKLNLKDEKVDYPQYEIKSSSDTVKKVKESFDVMQGKISLGFTTDIGTKDEEKYALVLFNSVYGSGAHSRLFNNVREKLSLCYYAYSRIDAFTGTMCVDSGVEFKNFSLAYDEILAQLKTVQTGDITENEIEIAKKAIINSLNSMKDSPSSLENYRINGLLGGKVTDIEDYISNIMKVTKEDVISVANKVKLHTVYYLYNSGKCNLEEI